MIINYLNLFCENYDLCQCAIKLLHGLVAMIIEILLVLVIIKNVHFIKKNVCKLLRT